MGLSDRLWAQFLRYSEVPNKRTGTFINFGDFDPPLRTLLGPLRLLNLTKLFFNNQGKSINL